MLSKVQYKRHSLVFIRNTMFIESNKTEKLPNALKQVTLLHRLAVAQVQVLTRNFLKDKQEALRNGCTMPVVLLPVGSLPSPPLSYTVWVNIPALVGMNWHGAQIVRDQIFTKTEEKKSWPEQLAFVVTEWLRAVWLEWHSGHEQFDQKTSVPVIDTAGDLLPALDAVTETHKSYSCGV